MITELSWGFGFLAAPNRSKKFFKKSRRAEFFFDEKFGRRKCVSLIGGKQLGLFSRSSMDMEGAESKFNG